MGGIVDEAAEQGCLVASEVWSMLPKLCFWISVKCGLHRLALAEERCDRGGMRWKRSMVEDLCG